MSFEKHVCEVSVMRCCEDVPIVGAPPKKGWYRRSIHGELRCLREAVWESEPMLFSVPTENDLLRIVSDALATPGVQDVAISAHRVYLGRPYTAPVAIKELDGQKIRKRAT